MPKESKKVAKRCAFSSLVSSFNHLYALCGTAIIVSDLVVCGASYHTQAAPSCDIKPHKQTRPDTISDSTHSCVFLYYITCIELCLSVCLSGCLPGDKCLSDCLPGDKHTHT